MEAAGFGENFSCFPPAGGCYFRRGGAGARVFRQGSTLVREPSVYTLERRGLLHRRVQLKASHRLSADDFRALSQQLRKRP